MASERGGNGGGFARDRQQAFRQGREERRGRECAEADRRQALRADGVQDDASYVPEDWDAPHGSFVVAVPELREVAVPDVVTGRAKRRPVRSNNLSAERCAAVEEAAAAIQQVLAEQADDVIDEIEADELEASEPHCAPERRADNDEQQVREKGASKS